MSAMLPRKLKYALHFGASIICTLYLLFLSYAYGQHIAHFKDVFESVDNHMTVLLTILASVVLAKWP